MNNENFGYACIIWMVILSIFVYVLWTIEIQIFNQIIVNYIHYNEPIIFTQQTIII